MLLHFIISIRLPITEVFQNQSSEISFAPQHLLISYFDNLVSGYSMFRRTGRLSDSLPPNCIHHCKKTTLNLQFGSARSNFEIFFRFEEQKGFQNTAKLEIQSNCNTLMVTPPMHTCTINNCTCCILMFQVVWARR